MTVQRRIRRLLSGEVERKRLKENLAEIDAYISTELEKAKPSTSEVGHSHSRQKQKIRASSPRYLTPPTAIPLAIEAGIATRFIESVHHSPVMQALPIKADPDSEDNNNHEEGNTILELDQTRSIEPVGIQLQEEAIDSSSKEANEENGKVQENVNEPMEKINVRETANETIENDEQTETIGAAIEGDKVQDNPDIVTEDDEVRKSISTNMASGLETIDEPVKVDKMQETLAVTIKDGKVKTLDSPMRTGEVEEGVDESIGNDKMKNDEIYKESIEDGNMHETIHASTEKDRVQEIHDELMNDEKSETIEAHTEHVEEQEQVDEPMESSQVREEQERVDESMESSKVREEHGRFDKPMETCSVSEEDAEAPTENANISEKVSAPMENDEIQEARDGLTKDDEAHETVEARTNKCVEEQGKVDEPMASCRVQDNVEAPAKNAKIEEKGGARATPREVTKDEAVRENLEAHKVECVKEQQERVNETPENSKLLENVEAPGENARIKEIVIAPTKNEEVRETPDGVMRDDEVGETVEAHMKHSKSEEELGNEPNDNSKIKERLDFRMKRDKIKEMVTQPAKEAAGACLEWSEVQKRLRSNRRKRKRFHVQSTF